ncbi:beta strand repeat-containing protein [Chryseobacterium nepalense]|uniref:DUF8202 domain-containing protein n=1 Tax=Chryseobacterium nepalense TaxID=1854498 RepID=A0ABY4KD74_9FLAO|nr:hypothetical protein [Chryseobacterium nepalense]UPQ77452.1 hypothetical protein M0D58_07930 [Chryseobacterium nepalense]
MKIFINYEPPQKGAVLIKAFLSRAVALVLLLTVSFIYAQSPGGVTGARLWYRADAGITQSGGFITQWNNQANPGNYNLVQNGAAGTIPSYNSTSNLINFNPSARFDGSNDRLSVSVPLSEVASGSNPYASSHYIVYRGLSTTSGALYSSAINAPSTWNIAAVTAGQMYITNRSIPTSAVAVNETRLQEFDGASNGATSYLNGSLISSAISAVTVGTSGGSPFFSVGVDPGGSAYSNADIAEVIVFNTAQPANRQRIESYLGLKYGITLGSPASVVNYTASDGTTIFWTGNATYQNNIAGIGRDDDSGLSQKQSQSSNSGIQPIIGNVNITATNLSNPNSLNIDKSFMMWGSDTGNTSFTTAFAFGGLNNRMARIWRVQETGTVGTVKVALKVSDLPGSVTNPTLLISSDAVFDGTDTRQTMVLETIGGVQYYTTTLDLTSGQFFSFAGFVTAPGGVLGSSLWLKADSGTSTVTNGSSVSQWNDQSPNLNNFVQSTVSSQPLFATNNTDNLNYNPVVKIGGAYRLNSSLNLSARDIISVSYPVGGDGIGGVTTTITCNSGYINRLELAGTTSYSGGNTANSYIQATSPSFVVSGKPVISHTALTGTAGTGKWFMNGLSLATSDLNNTPVPFNRLISIGGYVCNNSASQNLPEVIAYNTNLTISERLRINSYLAIKYGITLDQSTAQNYLASDGSTIFWDATANSTYKNNIAGIGRDDASALSQKQSQSINSGIEPVIGNGNIFDTNANNTNSFSTDKSFLVWGSDTGSTNFATAFAFGGLNNRMARIWRVQETGTVGTVKVALKASDLLRNITNPTLLVSSDAVFDGTDIRQAMALETIGGVQYYTTTVDLTSGQFFSFAAFVTAPGGVVGASLWLKADVNTDTTVNNATIASWANVINNDTYDASVSPKYLASGVNFNPSISFDGSNWIRYDGVSEWGLAGTNNFNVYTMFKPSVSSINHTLIASNTLNNTFQYVLTDTNNLQRIARQNTSFVYSGSQGPGTLPGVFQIKRNGSTFSASFNGIADLSSTSSYSFPTDTNTLIGTRPGGSQYLNGYLSEIIVYAPNSHTALEEQRIQSYLGIKYGVTLGSNSSPVNYLASDGTTIAWNATTNTGYNNNIAGIGRDDASALSQKQSQSVNSGIQPVIGNNNIFDTNANNPNSFGTDKTFMMWGSDTGTESFATSFAFGNSNFRMTRIWKVQETGTVGTVKVAIPASQLPVSIAQPTLLRSTDAVFDGTDTSISMNLETISGVQYYTATIDFASGQYFTFAAFLTAPGGVSGASVWLKADMGVTAAINTDSGVWDDSSGNNNDALSSSVSGRNPSLNSTSNLLNFNPNLSFSGNAELRINKNINPPAVGTIDFFTVTKGSGGILGNDNGFTDRFIDAFTVSSGQNDGGGNPINSSSFVGVNTSLPEIRFVGWRATSNSATTSFQSLNSGSVVSFTEANSDGGYGFFDIGDTGDFSPLNGNIGEVIAYDDPISTQDRLRVHSYLAIKYGITLNQSTATNYVSSSNNIIWDASANSTYNKNIAGIGRDGASALMQKQSQSANTGNQIIMGLASIAATNTANTGSFAVDNQFLVWGDNDQSSSSAFTGIPGYNSRLNRVWKVQNTNSLNQNVQVLVPLTLVPATSSLLAGTDATFAGSYQVYNPTGTVTVNSVSYRAFTLPAVMVNQPSFYMTFAFYEQSPGGVRSEALWLRGDAGLAGVTSWLDQSGNNRNLRWDITNCQGHTSRGQMVLGKTLNFNSVASFSDADWTWGFTQTDISRTTTPNADVAIVYKAVSPSVQDVWSTDWGGALDERALTTTQVSNDNTAIAYSGGNSGFATINVASFKNTTANGSNVLINGNNILNFTGNTKYVGCSQITIGDVWGAQNPFKGLIGEFVVYRSNITAIERIQLNSYLALKYGITLGRNNNGNATSGEVVSGVVLEGDYLASDGITRTWNSDAVYQNNIVGLGRDDISAFHQRITTSQSASADIITLSTDANFTNNNQSGGSGHTDIANDKSFFITGNNNAATSYTLKSGLSNGMNALMKRVWKTQNTGTSFDVYIKSSNAKASYLVYSADATFSSGVTYVLLTAGATPGIQIPNGNYFTFAAFLEAPGGVFDESLWLKADAGTSSTTNGTGLSQWDDQSDVGNNATQSNAGNRPVYSNLASSMMNYNPVVSFNGSNYLALKRQLLPIGTTGRTEFAVYAANSGYLLSYGANANSASYYGLVGRPLGLDSGQSNFQSGGGTSDSNPLMISHLFAGSGGASAFYRFGRAFNSANRNLNTSSSGIAAVGANVWNGGYNTLFNGRMPELIVYPKALNGTQRSQVDSYLAIKYGLTLDQTTPQNYLASDGVTVVWTAASGYNNNIIGLAKDRTATLHQRISTSQMPVKDIITLSTDNNFTNPNQSGAGGHTDIVNDRYFFMTGNNGQAAVFTQKTGLANNLRVVMSRVWRVQQTGTAQNIYINVNNSRATYLIYSTDPSFSSGITYVPLTSGTTSALQIPTGNYFTFAAPATGPGGVTDNLVRWYRADRDVTTGSTLRWADQMQNSDAVQSVAGNQPTYNTTGSALLNFNSSFTFNSANANYLSFSDTGMASGSTSRSVFGVGRTSVTGGTFEWISSYGTSGSGQNFGLMRSGNNVLVTTFGSDLLASTSNPYASNTPVLSYGAASGGTLFGTFNARPLTSIGGSVSTSLNVGRIGTRQSLGEYWNGIISEVVYYNKIPTTNEKQRVDSYMGLKYGVSLGTSSNLFTYLASDSTPFWTGDATYQNNIAAIGRDDFSDLQQKQSQSVNSGNQVILGLDTITGSNDTNTGSFDNDLQFLAWGDNNTAGTTPFTAVYPNRNRLSRVWKAQNTGSFGKDVQVLIPASLIGNLDVPSLLYSTSATFASGNLTYASTGTVNVNSVNYYSFTLPASQVNTPVFYFTIAYYTKAPGGVEGENLWLRADDGVSATTDNTPVSQWNDQSGSHGTQATGSKQPVYRNDISVNMNFNPVMNFSSASSQNFDITGDLAIGGQQSVATFAVADASAGARYFLEPKATGNNLLQFRSTTQGNSTLTLSNGTSVTNTLAGTGASVLYSGWRATGTLFAGVNGNAGTSVASATNWVNGPLSLGAAYNQTAFTNGKIPEVVEYSKSLTAIERQRVNSYLSLKYGITMDQSTIQDYLASDGTISWAKDAVYKFNIAGIGRDDITALNQKQSQSVNTGSQVAVSLGEAAATNSANINTFNTDMQYLVWGDDNGSLSTTTTTGNVLASNGNTYTKRMTRVWRMQNKGSFAQDVTVYFPASAFPSASAAGLIYATTAAKLSDGTATVIPAIGTATVNGTDYYAFPVSAASLAGLSYMSFTTATAVCYKPAVTAGTALNTKAGITSLARAGSAGDNWPMVRNGGWLALEAKTKGMVINRVRFNASNQPVADDGTTLILTSPIEGMLVMDVTNRIFKIYTSKDGGATYAWYAFGEQSCPD